VAAITKSIVKIREYYDKLEEYSAWNLNSLLILLFRSSWRYVKEKDLVPQNRSYKSLRALSSEQGNGDNRETLHIFGIAVNTRVLHSFLGLHGLHPADEGAPCFGHGPIRVDSAALPDGPVVGIRFCCFGKVEKLRIELDYLDSAYPKDLECPSKLASW
jgi:hypothetical protein